MLEVTPEIQIPETELTERFVRASGPGGQNVNKVATAVELRFDVARSSLPDDLKARAAAGLEGPAVGRQGGARPGPDRGLGRGKLRRR